MRLWSLHPRYLDRIGLLAEWREGLLAKKVLEWNTKGYRSHPQLARFRAYDDPIIAINAYLHAVVDEAENRGYSFDRTKLLPDARTQSVSMSVNRGQVEHETHHLLAKLSLRDPERYERLAHVVDFEVHPIFRVREGGKEDWEKS